MGPTNIERCCYVVIVVTWAALQQIHIGSHCIRIVQLITTKFDILKIHSRTPCDAYPYPNRMHIR
jgi:hypothetical protein